jgi:hypothetical protein
MQSGIRGVTHSMKPGNVMLHRSRELIAHNAIHELGRSRGG